MPTVTASGGLTPTAFEQEMLELVNRARSNPAGEFDALIADAATRTGVTSEISSALRYFQVDMTALRSQFDALSSAAPLAWNTALASAADGHTEQMIATDTQSHQLQGEAALGTRLQAAGYANARAWAENVFAYSQDTVYGHAGFFIDWGFTPTGIQTPAGHRTNLLNPLYTEVGIAVLAETNPTSSVGPYLMTQDFAGRAGYAAQLVGVVFNDNDADRFYDAGEGLGLVRVTAIGSAGVFSTTTWDSGGYQMVLPAGSYTVSFAGEGLHGSSSQTITIAGSNVKLDLNSDDITAQTSDLRGTTGADWLEADPKGHLIDGQAGLDMASFVALGAGAVIDLNSGSVIIGTESWTLVGIENVTGTIFGDLITGNTEANRLRGLGDYDWMVGSGGGDTFEGGTGRDTVAYSSATAGVIASLLTDRGSGGQANGDIYVDVENLTGSSFADRLSGDNDRNILRGLGGDDFIFGMGGNDTLDGGGGNDILDGGAGNDRLTGGRGNDVIDGGAGWDTALYSAARAQYIVTTLEDGRTSVMHTAGGSDGLDYLTGIEVLHFSDGSMFL